MSEEILKKINFHDENHGHAFEYDPESGFLRSNAGAYLLFRAEQSGDLPSLRRAEDTKLIYGKGLYTGNTPESVAPYTWIRPDNVINAYVTPELPVDAVHNRDHLSRGESLKGFAAMMNKRRRIGWQAVADAFEESYGDARLATFDAALDIKAGQHLLSTTKHPVPPRYAIWRGDSDELTRLGSAEATSRPHSWAVKIAQKRQNK